MRGTARTSAWHPAQRSGELSRVGAPGGDAGAGADRLRLILDGVPGEKRAVRPVLPQDAVLIQ